MSTIINAPNITAQLGDKGRVRKQRRPMHVFNLRYRPFVITPFMMAPVLPGETLRNLSIQQRIVSDPITDKLSGAHAENYLFYVKLRDLDGRDDFEQMLIDPGADVSSYYDTNVDTEYYYDPNGATNNINWLKLCYQRIVAEHFRGEEEAWNSHTDSVTGLAVASVLNMPGWLDSLTTNDDFTAEDVSISTAGDNAFTVRELEDAQKTYHLALLQGITQKSFQDYLRDSGVSTGIAKEPHVPELLLMERQWTYPTNAVEPTDGSVASAYVWSNTIRRTQAKFFSEPGFLVGLTMVRPKVYYSGINSSPAGGMTSMTSWLTPDLRNDPTAGWRQYNATYGPAGNGCDTEAYRFKYDDLLLYGDQFLNYAVDGNTNSVALPVDGTDLINRRYPSATDINEIFVDDLNASGLRFIRQDGICNLAVDSYLRDSVPGEPNSD